MKNYSRYMPEGVKDYVGPEAALKEKIQAEMKKLFESYNYHLIETPSFEYLDVFTVGEESYQQPSLYKLINRQGELMALRSDMTRAIARVVSTQKSTELLPQRYSYMANSFRYPERYQGKMHEFTQGGVELIGNTSISADAEVIELAVEALRTAGIENFSLHIGSSQFLAYTLEELGLGETCKEKVYEAIIKKDAVKLREVLSRAAIDKEMLELLLELVQSSGKIELLRSVKAKLKGEKIRGVLEDLEELYALLEDYGVSEKVLFDFSLLSYGKYYTGMMFQVFTHGIGTALVEGGRYDKLLSEFGMDLPAVGFGVHINLILQKRMKEEPLDDKQLDRMLVVSTSQTRRVCNETSRRLRSEGKIVENSLTEDLTEALAYAKALGMGAVIYFKQNEFAEVYALKEDCMTVIAVEEL